MFYNHLSYQARHLLSHVLNTDSGDIDIFEEKSTFEMLTVCGQQHPFPAHERMFLRECQKFLRQKMSRPEGNSNMQ